MKRIIYISAAIVTALALGACSKPNVDKDGVPLIKSASNPVVDGVKMTPKEFFQKYCTAPNLILNPTCNDVKLQAMQP